MRLPWPGQRALEAELAELRADSSSYTDALVAAITANAGGQTTALPDGDRRHGSRRRASPAGRSPRLKSRPLTPLSWRLIRCNHEHDRSQLDPARRDRVMLIRVDAERGLTLLPCQSRMTWRDPLILRSWIYRCSCRRSGEAP